MNVTPSTVETALERVQTGRQETNTAEDEQLKAVCNQFEGVLIGILLKESLASSSIDEDTESISGVTLLESAVEHAAMSMGRQGNLGLGKMLYASLAGKDTE